MLTKLFVVLCITFHVEPAKIFAIFPLASLSHQIVFQPIWRELSLRGHQVTVLTPRPLRDKSLTNLTEIDVSLQYEQTEQHKSEISKGPNHWTSLSRLGPTLERFMPVLFGHKQILSVINDNTSSYDVVLAEALAPITYVFAVKFGCPLIGVSSLGVSTNTLEALGNPVHPVLDPNFFTPYYGDDLTFYEKVDRVLFNLYEKYFFYYRYSRLLDRLLKKYFGESIPSVEEMKRNMSLLMLNTNPIIHGPQLYGPNVIQFGGGVHLKPKKPLPTELKEFLDSATEGVVYFSLGSNIESKYLPERKRKLLINTFANLPYKVLWKFEDDQLEGKPKNVRVEKWLPQQDVLGHLNIKLFITQGGLQSLEEALLNEVPLLVLPFVADQPINAKRVQKLGVGLHLDFHTLSEEMFTSTIIQIVEDKKFKEKAVEVRKLLEDQPMRGVEKVVWWTEYVIRNKGAPHLRNPRADVSWFDFLILDVVAFLLFILIASVFVVYRVSRFITSLVFTKRNPSKRKVH